ncbi:RING-H2 finger protein ATL51-like [Impatiens glandulifera]|uniref:RING-H2 finger protein ATL51-like n=1 Tax=Impatiens glandulifera TaxID=253017 RepID=UPI001FB17D28|nr:RING-H2 finger protein ATL51-like [Impatiens glandulifera]
MGSLSNPKIWAPYTNSKDCSQTLCSLHCPQWCYNILFPPPPPPLQFSGHSTPSTLLIAIIGLLASAFLLVTYYLVISKYCVNSVSHNSNESDRAQNEADEDHDHNHTNHMIHEPWLVTGTGLDESLIKSIAIFKYKRPENGSIVQGTECSVCLSEFQDDESFKLLPKCNHPFHVNCIDTWLKSHSNCPLCRANIVVFLSNQSSEPPSNDSHTTIEENAEPLQDEGNPKKTIIRAMSDLGRLDTVIEIKDEEHEMNREIRRTVSMSMVDHVL